jgi:toxin ParE1/3/4
VDYEVVLSKEAEADLTALHDYIFDKSGIAPAERYIARIYAACHSLASFPARGQPRSDLSPGLRTIPFERRATIAYTIEGKRVTIARVLYAGRDYESELADA